MYVFSYSPIYFDLWYIDLGSDWNDCVCDPYIHLECADLAARGVEMRSCATDEPVTRLRGRCWIQMEACFIFHDFLSFWKLNEILSWMDHKIYFLFLNNKSWKKWFWYGYISTKMLFETFFLNQSVTAMQFNIFNVPKY